jgi:23S rRNA pseudouridine1911/1915/1917 synthase
MDFVYDNELEERLDKFLSTVISDLSRTKIVDLIKSGGVSVDEKNVRKPSFKIESGQTVSIDIQKYEVLTTSLAKKADLEEFGNTGREDVILPENIKLDIVHEDEDLLVIDKPHGMVVHPGAGNYGGTLVNAVAYHFQEEGIDIPRRVGLVHRLDKQVSGLMIIAKNNIALRFLSEQFSGENIDSSIKAGKTYWAVVRSADLESTTLGDDERRVEGYVFRSRSDRKKYEFDTVSLGKGKKALSYIRVIEKGEKYGLLEIRIKTGRTHQIRTQLKYLGVPIVNDLYYGGMDMGENGIGLRCEELLIIHPGVYKKLGLKDFSDINILETKLAGQDRVSYSRRRVPLDISIV